MIEDDAKFRILFLCTGNSCRSQMAEALLRDAADDVVALSAGSKPAGYVHPLAVKAMQEIGLDVSSQTSKSIDEFVPPRGAPPDLIVSVCDAAASECPVFPGGVVHVHLPFDDPAHAEGDAEEQATVFRRVRDEIKAAIETNLPAWRKQSAND